MGLKHKLNLALFTCIVSLFSLPSSAKQDIFDTKTIYEKVGNCNNLSQAYYPTQNRMPRHCFKFESAASVGLANNRDSKEGTVVRMSLIDTGISDIFSPNVGSLSKNQYFKEWKQNLESNGAKDPGGKAVALMVECARFAQMHAYQPGESVVFYSEENVGPGEQSDLDMLTMIPRNPKGRGNGPMSHSTNEPFLSLAKDAGEPTFRNTGQSPQMNFKPDGSLQMSCPAVKSVYYDANKVEKPLVVPEFSMAGKPVSADVKKNIIEELKIKNFNEYINTCDGGISGSAGAPMNLAAPVFAPAVQFTIDPIEAGVGEAYRPHDGKFYNIAVDGVTGEMRLAERVPANRVEPEFVHQIGLASARQEDTSVQAGPGKGAYTFSNFYLATDETFRFQRGGGIPMAGPGGYTLQMKGCNFKLNSDVFLAENPTCSEIWLAGGLGKVNPQAVGSIRGRLMDAPYGFRQVLESASKVVAPCTQLAVRAARRLQQGQPASPGTPVPAPGRAAN